MAANLEYPVAEPPAHGSAQPLVDGIHWVRLPVPGALKHINVWLLEDGDGWTLVDTGMDVAPAREAWEGPLAAYLGGRPLRRIICTHHHPDHAGLAAWLAARHGAPVFMTAREFELLAMFRRDDRAAERGERYVAAFARDGLEAGPRERRMLSGEGYSSVVSGVPTDVRRLAGGETIRIGALDWSTFEVAGHTESQLVLHAPAAGVLIAGDQVLPRITSNVGVYPWHDDPDPLASYLDSFAALAALDPEPLVLPSHGEVFVGLRARILGLRDHHAATLERVLALVTGPTSARELAAGLFRPDLDALNLMLAVAESLANLEYLARRGRLVAETPAGGPRRYRPPLQGAAGSAGSAG
jgi:glyoxylase-like metal-dependent hydrolase (beta-lactamase superfamily II)